MNGWAIAALVFAAGCLGVAVWALSERYRYKGLLAAAKWGRELAKDHDMQARKSMEVEITDLQLRADALLQDRDTLALQLKEATEARTRAAQARAQSTSSGLEASLNDLPKPKPTRTPRANSRAKSPNIRKEGENNG